MRNNEIERRLGQLRDLKHEVDELSQRIARLEAEAGGTANRAPGPARRYGECLTDVRSRMDARRLACMEELGRLYAFIDDIPDSRLRRIFSFRYIDGMTWQQVAFRIGEYDEQYPRRLHNRYINAIPCQK